ncbi:helix-turn-helix domain-containing protein [Halorubrum ezzemoulense]|uniref:helix-turn-helix domain-containing protein n=1 Tax=Halorubrum ezzemoulense TaxID=337243 RepID=UPI00232DF6EC|nr:helix-turn-helix domain-containing protein [Halorubrum ezzemoulense]MDB2270247.1 helix-turn-helix domain-containing protein [Halorubrum ezzemoulense]
MHAARVALEIPHEHLHPMHRFVCESPAVDRETILERDAGGELTTLLLHVAGDRRRYERTVEEVPQVEEWTTTDAEEGFYVYVRTRLRDRERRYREALDRDAVLVVPPVELRSDRTVRQTLVGRSDALSAVVEALPAAVDVEVLRTGTYDRSLGVRPSERQREALAAAWAAGYYEVPREGGIEAVAEALDCATSTASDLLRRAERRVVAAALDERA